MNLSKSQSQKSCYLTKLSTKELVLCGMFAAIMSVISQISIPMPTGVPITIQVFGITLIGSVLGWKRGLVTTLAYLLIGVVGIPVFAGFHSGIGILFGLTGGYILSWPIMVVFCGLRPKYNYKILSLLLRLLLSLIGLAINELAGALQWSFLAGDAMSLKAILVYSLTAFIPKDIFLTIMGVLIGNQIRRLLVKSHFLI